MTAYLTFIFDRCLYTDFDFINLEMDSPVSSLGENFEVLRTYVSGVPLR